MHLLHIRGQGCCTASVLHGLGVARLRVAHVTLDGRGGDRTASSIHSGSGLSLVLARLECGKPAAHNLLCLDLKTSETDSRWGRLRASACGHGQGASRQSWVVVQKDPRVGTGRQTFLTGLSLSSVMNTVTPAIGRPVTAEMTLPNACEYSACLDTSCRP